MNYKITSSIVIYNNDEKILKSAIKSVLNVSSVNILFLIDNSEKNIFFQLKKIDSRIIYIHNPSNPGYGSGHNIAIKKAITFGSKYHFIVNPDIYFNNNIIDPMIQYMKLNSNIGMMMPKILNKDNSVQFLPKLLPNPLSIILRKIKYPSFLHKKFINWYELRFVDQEKIYYAPIISGCFTLLNANAIKKIGMYDDSFFMYFEDWDLSRRINQKFKTVYYPKVSVYHEYNSEANKNKKLFKIFLRSAFNYFNKWGWFFDKNRSFINKKTLDQFK